MPAYQIDVYLEEPATFGEAPAVGNDAGTLDFVPATALRGALAAALARSVPKPEADSRLEAWFGQPFPRWTPAFPVTTDRKALCVPMPACLVAEKGERAFQFLNTSQIDPLPETAAEYTSIFGEAPKGYQGDYRIVWQAARARWLAVDTAGYPFADVTVPTGRHMHLALHYARQSHRQEQLFSRQGIEAARVIQNFRAFVDDPNGVIRPEEQIERIYMGKRRSAGNGAARLSWKTVEKPFWPMDTHAGKTVLVQLMSDAIVAGKSGGTHRSMPLNDDSNFIASSFHESPGWSSKWRLPRESVLTVSAGSVFRLASDQLPFVENGIGLRRNEGFGWVAVNPPWLSEPLLQLSKIGVKADAAEPLEWPGFPDSDTRDSRRRLRVLHDKARQVAKLSSRHLNAVSVFSRRVNEISQLLGFLDQMANRANTRGWDKVRNLLAPHLKDCTSIHDARFLLEAANTYSTPED